VVRLLEFDNINSDSPVWQFQTKEFGLPSRFRDFDLRKAHTKRVLNL